MHWKKFFTSPATRRTIVQIGAGVTTGSSILVGVVWWKTQNENKAVLASWTTNHEPSVKWNPNWDRRDPESLVKPMKDEWDKERYNLEKKKVTPSATRHLFLIRHGNYVMEGELDEQHVLTNLGRQQADYVGKRIKELELPYTFMLNSTMTRAIETSDIMYKHLPQIPRKTCAMIREGAPCPPEPPVGHWRPEAQQFYEDGARIEAAFRKYFHRADAKQEKDSYEIMVCHANVIRYFVCRAMQFPPEAWLRLTLHHCSITWLTIRPNGRVVLRAVGDSGHLPREFLSTS